MLHVALTFLKFRFICFTSKCLNLKCDQSQKKCIQKIKKSQNLALLADFLFIFVKVNEIKIV